LTLVVILGYLDVVTQNFRPLALPPAHLGTDEVIDCRLTDENGVMETAGNKKRFPPFSAVLLMFKTRMKTRTRSFTQKL
jgi:hypothetical protein